MKSKKKSVKAAFKEKVVVEDDKSGAGIPYAFISAAIMVLIFSAVIVTVIANKDIEISDFNGSIHKALHSEAKLEVFTNSRGGWGILPKTLNDAFFTADKDEVVLFSLEGGMPRAFLSVMESTDYRIIDNNDVAVLCIAPGDFNRYNKFFVRTLEHFFTWKEVITELLPRGRFDDIRYFVINYGIPVMRYRYDLQKAFGWDERRKVMEEKKEKNTGEKYRTAEISRYKEDYYRDYTIDEYQADSYIKLIRNLRKRGAFVVIVIMPLSPDLRYILGRDNTAAFLKEVDMITHKLKVPVIDYFRGYDGTEYEYSDGSHFAATSKMPFTEKLIDDLRPYIEESGVLRDETTEQK